MNRKVLFGKSQNLRYATKLSIDHSLDRIWDFIHIPSLLPAVSATFLVFYILDANALTSEQDFHVGIRLLSTRGEHNDRRGTRGANKVAWKCETLTYANAEQVREVPRADRFMLLLHRRKFSRVNL